jgi:sterol desaturase/sphingolipid hydroxylase (fatty acid hydroxylase superfamily)
MLNRMLPWLLWPLLFTAYVTTMSLVAIYDAESLDRWLSLAALTLIVLLIGLEELLPYRRDWSIRGDKERWRDIGHLLLYANVGAMLAQIVFISGSAALLAWAGLERGVGLWPTTAPFVVQLLLVIALGDLLEYWTHRLTHTVPWLWSLHAIHHSPERLSTIKGGRHHVIYFLARGLVAWLPLMVLGAPRDLILWQVAALGATGVLSHANIAFRIPAFVQRIFVTPAYHRIHHSLDMKEGNSNFAVVLPLWDMLFGTHVDPTRTEPHAVGVDRDPIPRSFLAEILSPVTYRQLVRNRARN